MKNSSYTYRSFLLLLLFSVSFILQISFVFKSSIKDELAKNVKTDGKAFFATKNSANASVGDLFEEETEDEYSKDFLLPLVFIGDIIRVNFWTVETKKVYVSVFTTKHTHEIYLSLCNIRI